MALVETTLQEWKHRHQTTLIWATHQMHQAQRVADQVVLMLNGQMIETASREDFFHRPADVRTADFVTERWCIDEPIRHHIAAVVATLFLQGCSESGQSPTSVPTEETHSENTKSTEKTEKT